MASLYSFTIFAVLVLGIEGYILKSRQLTVPKKGITLEINIKPHSTQSGSANVEIDLLVKQKHVRVLKPAMKKALDELPRIEARHGIRHGRCPAGYKRMGAVCVPEGDY